MRVSYHGTHPVEDPTDVSSQKIQLLSGPSEKNKTIIADLLEHDVQEHKGMMYTVDAVIASFMAEQSWRYGACPICNVTMDPQEGSYVCIKHREQEPNFNHLFQEANTCAMSGCNKYCVKCNISDGSGTIPVTIFDQALFDMIRVSCNDMVRVHGNVQPMAMPKQIEALKNQRKIYQLNNVSTDSDGNLRFAVNRTYRAEVGVKRILDHGSTSSQPEGKKPEVALTNTPPRTVIVEDAVKLPVTLAVDIEKQPHVTNYTLPTPAGAPGDSSVQPEEAPTARSTHVAATKQLFKETGGDSSAGKHDE